MTEPNAERRVVVGGQTAPASALASALGGQAGTPRLVVADHAGRSGFLKRLLEGDAPTACGVVAVAAGAAFDGDLRRQLFVLAGLGIQPLAIAITGLGEGDAGRFAASSEAVRAALADLGAPMAIVPVAAGGAAVPTWHYGADLTATLRGSLGSGPLRLAVVGAATLGGQPAYRARVLSGSVAAGEGLVFSPSNRLAKVTAVTGEGESVVLHLDADPGVGAGEIASHEGSPPVETDVFIGHMVWLAAGGPVVERTYTLRRGNGDVAVRIQSVDSAAGEAIKATFRTGSLIALDPFERYPATGWFRLYDGAALAACGTMGMRGYADQRFLITVRATNIVRVEHAVSTELRARRNGHRSGVLWMTGLSGSGKSTISIEVEKRLFEKGYQVYVLDGDNVRHGLNSNLGFSPEDRAENIRRVGEVAALFARAGVIVLTAFISPYRSDRDRARAAFREGFHEIYVHADLETCEARDPKGLYKKARKGEIKDFTGISAPYEAPENPELGIDTGRYGVEDSVRMVVDYIDRHFALRVAA